MDHDGNLAAKDLGAESLGAQSLNTEDVDAESISEDDVEMFEEALNELRELDELEPSGDASDGFEEGANGGT